MLIGTLIKVNHGYCNYRCLRNLFAVMLTPEGKPSKMLNIEDVESNKVKNASILLLGV